MSKVDYNALTNALLQSDYFPKELWESGVPCCDVYAISDEEEGEPLAFIQGREGFIKTRVTRIDVYDKKIDEFFQRVIGLDYFRLRRTT